MADGLIGKTDAQIADAARSRQIIYLRNLCRQYERVIMLCADEITKLHMQITELERERRAEKH